MTPADDLPVARREPGPVTREEAAAMLFSGDYDGMTAGEFAARYPCAEITSPDLPDVTHARARLASLRERAERRWKIDRGGGWVDVLFLLDLVDALLAEQQQDKELLGRILDLIPAAMLDTKEHERVVGAVRVARAAVEKGPTS